MIEIDPKSKVKVFLHNGMIVEGVVLEWTPDRIQIQTYIDDAITIIHNPQDIFLTKLFNLDKTEENKSFVPQILEKEFADTYKEPTAPQTPEGNLRLQKLVELKILMKEQEKKIVANKLCSHTPSSGIGQVSYGSPGFHKD